MIYGGGMVFARTGNATVAWDVRVGRQAWSVPEARFDDSVMAFGGGVVVSATRANGLRALDARSGATRWQAALPSSGQEYVPIPAAGAVFVAGGSEVVAYDLATGRRRWSAPADRVSAPISSDGVRVYGSRLVDRGETASCVRAFALDVSTGARLWESPSAGCTTEGPPYVHRNRVYLDDDDRVLDATSGARIGSYPGSRPILTDTVSLFDAPPLIGRDPATGRVLWTNRPPSPLNGGDDTPVAAGHTIYALTGDELVAVGMDRGVTEQRLKLPGPSGGLTRAAVGTGVVAASRGNRLTLFESLYTPPAAGVEAGAETPALEFGRRTLVDGIVGASLRPARPKVDVLADASPFGRLRRALTVPSDGGGYFSLTAKPVRNTRLRVRAGAARSNTVRLYVYPRFRSKLRRGRRNPNRIRATVRVAGPRGVRLGGRRVTLYIGRVGKRRYDRLGVGRLRAAGPGRARGTVQFSAIRGVRSNDFLFFCVRRTSRLGLGRADVVDRRCGARRLPLR